jgi:hypothetical protein
MHCTKRRGAATALQWIGTVQRYASFFFNILILHFLKLAKPVSVGAKKAENTKSFLRGYN